MSEEAAQTQATETETGEQEAPKPKPTETVEFWKQKAREQEQRAKANAEAAQKLQQFEDRDKTEAQKLQERAEAAEKRAAEIEGRAIRLEVAAEKGLTPAQAQRLVGETREQLEADADALLEMFKPAAADESEQIVPSLDLGTTRGAPMPLNGDPLEKALRNSLGIT